ncbi:MAG: hypothetical protein WBV61_00710 [Rhodanobacteraceae bacterium]
MSLKEEISAAIEQEEWITVRSNAVMIPTHPRHQMMGGLFYQVLEHAVAVRVLLGLPHPLHGSAAALMRPIFEMYVRGLWIRDCATDAQFEQVSSKDDERWPVGIEKMTEAVDEKIGFNRWLTDLQKKYWDAFCSYAHGGLRLIARNNSSEAIESRVTEEESIEILRFVVLISLFATSIWCDIAGDADGAKEAASRAKSYLEPAA